MPATATISIDTRAFDGLTFRIQKSKRIDNRRMKEYARKVEFVFRLQMTEYCFGQRTPWVSENDFKKALYPLAKDSFETPDIAISIGPAHVSAFRIDKEVGPHGYTYVSVTVIFTAEKPSKIPSEGACLAHLDNGDTLIPLLQVPIDVENARYANMLHREQVAEYATWVAKAVARDIEKKARALCRYDARMAGLDAEYATHVQELSTDEALSAYWTDEEFELAPGLADAEVFDNAARHLGTFLDKKIGRPGFLRASRHPSKIQPDDLIAAEPAE